MAARPDVSELLVALDLLSRGAGAFGPAERLLTFTYGLPALDIAAVTSAVGQLESPVALSTLVEPMEGSDPGSETWPLRLAVLAAVYRRARGACEPRVVDGDLEIRDGEQVVVESDLRVSGTIVIVGSARLVVAGSIDAAHLIERNSEGEDFGYYGTVATGGDLRVTGLCATGGACAVAGSLHGRVIYAYYNQGSLRVGDGIRADVVLESDHGGSEVFGESAVDVALVDELRGIRMQTTAEYDEAAELARLVERVAPEHRAWLAKLDPTEFDSRDIEQFDELAQFLCKHALAGDLFASHS